MVWSLFEIGEKSECNDMSSSNPSSSPTLRRTLGLFDGIAILIGITIGAGIFSTPQIIATYFSSFPVILAFWLLAGGFVFIGVLIYAELGTRLPNTGGEYVYLTKAFGPYVGFIFGWAQLFIIRTSPAAGLSIIATDYLQYFVPLSADGQVGVAAFFILILGVLNYIGIRAASMYQKFSTVFKIGGVFFLVAVGLFVLSGSRGNLAATAPATGQLGDLGNVAAAMMLIVFSYLGWDRVGYVAGEMKNPRRTIPVSLFVGIAIIALVYGLINLLYHQTLGMEGVRGSTRLASEVATVLLGGFGAGLVAIIVIISATGSTNGTMMTAPRVYYAMAKDKLFFNWFSFIHPKFRTPSHAIIAHCVWAIVILLVRKNFQTIVAGMTFVILIFYAMTTIALFKFRKENIGEQDHFRMPFYPVLPAIYLIGIVLLVGIRGYYQWQDSLMDLAFIATGIPFAIYWCRKHRK
jgi:basic amino acid/polyamine antiporter, APA family